LPHLELTREIVRRFKSLFGDVFPEPVAKLTQFPMIVGLNGTGKMSKSADNHLEVAASPEEIRQRISGAFTDPARVRKSDPGHPEICNVYSLHRIFSPDVVQEIDVQCRGAQIGCVQCKRQLAENVVEYFGPFRERRKELEARPDYVRDVIRDGAARAGAIARETIADVKQAMNLIPS
jgi:tryptophanyl-tRNA synthetase